MAPRAPSRRQAGASALWVAAVLALVSCGPGTLNPADAAVQDALLSGEYVEFSPAARRAQLFAEARAEAEAQARDQLLDGPAVVAIEHEGHLFAAPLPDAASLLAGASLAVDVDSSSEPWPTDVRDTLGGATEKELAATIGASLAASLGANGTVVVVRAPNAPYAAALVQGELHLNPALLYLAASAAPDATAQRRQPLSPPGGNAMSCSAAGGALLPWMAVALALPLRRRRG